MATAPYQLWMDLAPISTAIRVASTVTITTASAHGLTSGAYVQVDSTTGVAGTSMTGVYQVTVTSTTAFTYTAAGSAGTATSTTAVISVDLMNPPVNYTSGTNRQGAMIADVSSIALTANGDGSGAAMSATILQESTPAGGPWFTLVPDQTRIRFAIKDTGSTPVNGDVLFLGYLAGFTSKLNGSGQGTETMLNLADVNAVLDRVAVYGKTGQTKRVRSASRSSNVSTVTVGAGHGFVAGQKITIKGVPGGGTVAFNTDSATITSLNGTDGFKFSQTGPNSTNGGTAQGYTISKDGNSIESVIFTAISANNAWIETGKGFNVHKGSLTFTGFGAPLTTTLQGFIYDNDPQYGKNWPGESITKLSGTTFRARFPAPVGSTYVANYKAGSYGGTVWVAVDGFAWDASNTNGQNSVVIRGGVTETDAVKQLLGVVDSFHTEDYALQRLISTTTTTNIVGGTTYTPPDAMVFPSTSLRSGLDSIIENYQGSDIKDRRYYINPQAQLVFNLVDATAKPTYATAPYKIIVTGAGTPSTTTGAATVAPYNLEVTWDHDTVKRAQFNTPSVTNQGGQDNTILDYTELTYDDGTTKTQKFPTRAGAPLMDTIVDYPNAQTKMIKNAANAYFVERYKPILSGRLTLRGAGTAAHNNIGFFRGYYQSGASTYALTSWAPGQWVDITAAGLSLSGLYRVEEVSLSFETGSYNQIVDITFNRKNPSDLASLIANQRSK